mmetsp:Transcript_28363/g.60442  ORF Transcript_28363/g.60442 Transcript_28363/m.60442 type:complete len:232 (+) Transcript_28363:2243-2938(+)
MDWEGPDPAAAVAYEQSLPRDPSGIPLIFQPHARLPFEPPVPSQRTTIPFQFHPLLVVAVAVGIDKYWQPQRQPLSRPPAASTPQPYAPTHQIFPATSPSPLPYSQWPPQAHSRVTLFDPVPSHSLASEPPYYRAGYRKPCWMCEGVCPVRQFHFLIRGFGMRVVRTLDAAAAVVAAAAMLNQYCCCLNLSIARVPARARQYEPPSIPVPGPAPSSARSTPFGFHWPDPHR